MFNKFKILSRVLFFIIVLNFLVLNFGIQPKEVKAYEIDYFKILNYDLSIGEDNTLVFNFEDYMSGIESIKSVELKKNGSNIDIKAVEGKNNKLWSTKHIFLHGNNYQLNLVITVKGQDKKLIFNFTYYDYDRLFKPSVSVVNGDIEIDIKHWAKNYDKNVLVDIDILDKSGAVVVDKIRKTIEELKSNNVVFSGQGSVLTNGSNIFRAKIGDTEYKSRIYRESEENGGAFKYLNTDLVNGEFNSDGNVNLEIDIGKKLSDDQNVVIYGSGETYKGIHKSETIYGFENVQIKKLDKQIIVRVDSKSNDRYEGMVTLCDVSKINKLNCNMKLINENSLNIKLNNLYGFATESDSLNKIYIYELTDDFNKGKRVGSKESSVSIVKDNVVEIVKGQSLSKTKNYLVELTDGTKVASTSFMPSPIEITIGDISSTNVNLEWNYPNNYIPVTGDIIDIFLRDKNNTTSFPAKPSISLINGKNNINFSNLKSYVVDKCSPGVDYQVKFVLRNYRGESTETISEFTTKTLALTKYIEVENAYEINNNENKAEPRSKDIKIKWELNDPEVKFSPGDKVEIFVRPTGSSQFTNYPKNDIYKNPLFTATENLNQVTSADITLPSWMYNFYVDLIYTIGGKKVLTTKTVDVNTDKPNGDSSSNGNSNNGSKDANNTDSDKGSKYYNRKTVYATVSNPSIEISEISNSSAKVKWVYDPVLNAEKPNKEETDKNEENNQSTNTGGNSTKDKEVQNTFNKYKPSNGHTVIVMLKKVNSLNDNTDVNESNANFMQKFVHSDQVNILEKTEHVFDNLDVNQNYRVKVEHILQEADAFDKKSRSVKSYKNFSTSQFAINNLTATQDNKSPNVILNWKTSGDIKFGEKDTIKVFVKESNVSDAQEKEILVKTGSEAQKIHDEMLKKQDTPNEPLTPEAKTQQEVSETQTQASQGTITQTSQGNAVQTPPSSSTADEKLLSVTIPKYNKLYDLKLEYNLKGKIVEEYILTEVLGEILCSVEIKKVIETKPKLITEELKRYKLNKLEIVPSELAASAVPKEEQEKLSAVLKWSYPDGYSKSEKDTVDITVTEINPKIPETKENLLVYSDEHGIEYDLLNPKEQVDLVNDLIKNGEIDEEDEEVVLDLLNSQILHETKVRGKISEKIGSSESNIQTSVKENSSEANIINATEYTMPNIKQDGIYQVVLKFINDGTEIDQVKTIFTAKEGFQIVGLDANQVRETTATLNWDYAIGSNDFQNGDMIDIYIADKDEKHEEDLPKTLKVNKKNKIEYKKIYTFTHCIEPKSQKGIQQECKGEEEQGKKSYFTYKAPSEKHELGPILQTGDLKNFKSVNLKNLELNKEYIFKVEYIKKLQLKKERKINKEKINNVINRLLISLGFKEKPQAEITFKTQPYILKSTVCNDGQSSAEYRWIYPSGYVSKDGDKLEIYLKEILDNQNESSESNGETPKAFRAKTDTLFTKDSNIVPETPSQQGSNHSTDAGNSGGNNTSQETVDKGNLVLTLTHSEKEKLSDINKAIVSGLIPGKKYESQINLIVENKKDDKEKNEEEQSQQQKDRTSLQAGSETSGSIQQGQPTDQSQSTQPSKPYTINSSKMNVNTKPFKIKSFAVDSYNGFDIVAKWEMEHDDMFFGEKDKLEIFIKRKSEDKYPNEATYTLGSKGDKNISNTFSDTIKTKFIGEEQQMKLVYTIGGKEYINEIPFNNVVNPVDAQVFSVGETRALISLTSPNNYKFTKGDKLLIYAKDEFSVEGEIESDNFLVFKGEESENLSIADSLNLIELSYLMPETNYDILVELKLTNGQIIKSTPLKFMTKSLAIEDIKLDSIKNKEAIISWSYGDSDINFFKDEDYNLSDKLIIAYKVNDGTPIKEDLTTIKSLEHVEYLGSEIADVKNASIKVDDVSKEYTVAVCYELGGLLYVKQFNLSYFSGEVNKDSVNIKGFTINWKYPSSITFTNDDKTNVYIRKKEETSFKETASVSSTGTNQTSHIFNDLESNTNYVVNIEIIKEGTVIEPIELLVKTLKEVPEEILIEDIEYQIEGTTAEFSIPNIDNLNVNHSESIGLKMGDESYGGFSVKFNEKGTGFIIEPTIPKKKYKNIEVNIPLQDGKVYKISIKEFTTQPENLTQDWLSNSYWFAFERFPDEEGYNYWYQDKMLKNDISGEYFLVNLMFAEDEFTNRNLSDNDLIAALYQIVVNREYDQQGLDFWIKTYNEYLKNANGDKKLAQQTLVTRMVYEEEFGKLCKNVGIYWKQSDREPKQ